MGSSRLVDLNQSLRLLLRRGSVLWVFLVCLLFFVGDEKSSAEGQLLWTVNNQADFQSALDNATAASASGVYQTILFSDTFGFNYFPTGFVRSFFLSFLSFFSSLLLLLL